MKTISEADLRLVNTLKDRGVMESVRPDMVDMRGGFIVVLCSDGKHMYDKFTHLANTFRQSCDRFQQVSPQSMEDANPPIHPLAMHGGALCLSPRWPTSEEGIVIKRHITQAVVRLGKGNLVLLYAHLLCGAASANSLSMVEVLDYLVDAYREVCNLDLRLDVDCRVHVYRPDGERRTYRFSVKKWQEFKRLELAAVQAVNLE